MARHLFPSLLLSCLGFVTTAGAQQLLVVDVQVTGNMRLPGPAVISAGGLVKGRTITTNDLDQAMANLDNTGLFTSLSYRYDPKTIGGKSGFAVTLQVAEAPVVSSVRLDIPGVDEQELWQEVKRENGLVDNQIPARQEATEYYKSAIKAALKKLNHEQDVVAKNEVDLKTGKRILAIQGADLPKISGIAFEGNRLIASPVLEAALAQASFLGEGYTENYVRLLLDANVKPLYEERGHLTAAFPHVGITPSAGGVLVSASVEEGPEWTLGKAGIAGDSVPAEEMQKAAKFPEGRLANWKQISAGIEDAKKVLLRDGYLGVAAQVGRSYHDENHVVDLAVKVSKGKQFFFGALELSGLAPDDTPQARGMWQLAEGAPMNPLYVDDYLRALYKNFKGIKSISQGLRPRPGSQIVDVNIKVTPR